MRFTAMFKPYELSEALRYATSALVGFSLIALGCAPRLVATARSAPAVVPSSPAPAPLARDEAKRLSTTVMTSDEDPPAVLPQPDGYQAAPQQLDDDVAATPPEAGVEVEHPLAHLNTDQLEQALLSDPASLGSMSVGAPNAGRLFNGVKMPEGEHYQLMAPSQAWGTEETVGFVTRCIDSVASESPGTPPLPIGHISSRRGGPLSPHVSHQSGRDVDLGYYYTDDSPWYTRASDNNLDKPRTWHLVRCLVTETDVEMILIDVSVQRLLKAYARSVGEDPDWLDSIFDGVPGKLPPLIRHAQGHATHIHVRFYNPMAQETARRVDQLLIEHDKISAPTRIVSYKVKKGDSLGKLARRFKTSVTAIQRANGLRSTLIRTNVTYRIPCPAAGPLQSAPVRVPPRRLPPSELSR